MKKRALFASMFGLTLTLAACGSEETGSNAPTSATSTAPSDDETEVCTADTWDNYGAQFFQDTCAQCHKNFTNHKVVTARASKMIGKIESDEMPKTGPLPADDKQRILTYLACGAP